MRGRGATVVAISDPNIDNLREANRIPAEAVTCHASKIGGYVVEGHVPAEAIARLLAERPDAVGIVVPGMPEDSPGMGGNQSTWTRLEVFLIGRDGSLTPFKY